MVIAGRRRIAERLIGYAPVAALTRPVGTTPPIDIPASPEFVPGRPSTCCCAQKDRERGHPRNDVPSTYRLLESLRHERHGHPLSIRSPAELRISKPVKFEPAQSPMAMRLETTLVHPWPRQGGCLAFSFDLYCGRGADSGCPGDSSDDISCLAEPALNWGSFGSLVGGSNAVEEPNLSGSLSTSEPLITNRTRPSPEGRGAPRRRSPRFSAWGLRGSSSLER